MDTPWSKSLLRLTVIYHDASIHDHLSHLHAHAGRVRKIYQCTRVAVAPEAHSRSLPHDAWLRPKGSALDRISAKHMQRIARPRLNFR